MENVDVIITKKKIECNFAKQPGPNPGKKKKNNQINTMHMKISWKKILIEVLTL